MHALSTLTALICAGGGAGRPRRPFCVLDLHVLTLAACPVKYADVGRPRSKDVIRISNKTSVQPIVAFLRRALRIRIEVPQFSYSERGIEELTNIDELKAGLKDRTIGAIYLPNLRWFPGEEVS